MSRKVMPERIRFARSRSTLARPNGQASRGWSSLHMEHPQMEHAGARGTLPWSEPRCDRTSFCMRGPDQRDWIARGPRAIDGLNERTADRRRRPRRTAPSFREPRSQAERLAVSSHFLRLRSLQRPWPRSTPRLKSGPSAASHSSFRLPPAARRMSRRGSWPR